MIEWLSLLRDGGLVVGALLILVSGAREVWVWGWTYRAMQQDRDDWKSLALRNLDLAQRGTSLADHALNREVRP